ncbi:hypothetical protein [Mesonia aestuariivivens]|uniref:Uncharacterized protein n=1 Tax=Mesonia aestuariivivens TaxID=2796128 RepID=A0ABS6W0E2_9FLAO|nr:hypothetical protein [Mesonia aestuariivivens]MBW2961330.1 hypothetical protein [Mesonia aestuariivivens]
MEDINFLQLFFNLLPALIIGLISYYFYSSYMTNENNRRIFELKRENSKNALPQRLQALERMTLFLERINPGSLLIRVKPLNENKNDYENLLIKTIEQEFEHNLAQQIYVSDKCWGAIRATKNATISLIRQTNMSDKVESPDKLREVILSDLVDRKAPSETGLAYLKNEVREIW